MTVTVDLPSISVQTVPNSISSTPDIQRVDSSPWLHLPLCKAQGRAGQGLFLAWVLRNGVQQQQILDLEKGAGHGISLNAHYSPARRRVHSGSLEVQDITPNSAYTVLSWIRHGAAAREAHTREGKAVFLPSLQLQE